MGNVVRPSPLAVTDCRRLATARGTAASPFRAQTRQRTNSRASETLSALGTRYVALAAGRITRAAQFQRHVVFTWAALELLPSEMDR